jgi:hypothetical protein
MDWIFSGDGWHFSNINGRSRRQIPIKKRRTNLSLFHTHTSLPAILIVSLPSVRPSIVVHYPFFDSRLAFKMSIEPPDRRPRQVMEHLGRDRTDGLHTHTRVPSIHDDDRPARWSLNWPTGCCWVWLGCPVWRCPSVGSKKRSKQFFPPNSPVS